MKTKCVMWMTFVFGIFLLVGCASSRTSNQPWDKPMPEVNNPGYNSQDPFPLNQGLPPQSNAP